VSDKLNGVFPALVSPMTAERKLDLDTLARHVNWLIDQGVHGIAPLGSTGEFYAMTADERTAVLETVFAANNGRVPIVVGANAAATREVVGYCRQAESMGAAGVLLAPPYYSLPTPDELFAHFAAVDAAIDIPIMLYNYPGRAGVDMTPDQIERLAGLDAVQYVKESTGDITRISQIIERCGARIAVFCGADTIMAECFLLGATGWVAGIGNVLPREHVELFRLAVVERDFDAAVKLQYHILPVMAKIEHSGRYTQYVKAGCEAVGQPVGPPREPLQPLSDEDLAELRELIRKIQA
jgi:4-hydroxy-tetrahydrodipicolinate synthase